MNDLLRAMLKYGKYNSVFRFIDTNLNVIFTKNIEYNVELYYRYHVILYNRRLMGKYNTQ